MSDAGGWLRDPSGADAAIERIQRQIQEAREREATASSVRSAIGAIRGVATSPRKEATVTVDPAGRLLDVKLTIDAVEMTPRALSELIVKLARQATQSAGEQAVAIAAESYGPQSGIVGHLRGEIAERTADYDGEKPAT